MSIKYSSAKCKGIRNIFIRKVCYDYRSHITWLPTDNWKSSGRNYSILQRSFPRKKHRRENKNKKSNLPTVWSRSCVV